MLAAALSPVLLFGSWLVPVCVDLALPDARPPLSPVYADWKRPALPTGERRHVLLWMIDGLENGRVAFVAKLHHAMADGAASAEAFAYPDPDTAALQTYETFGKYIQAE